MKMEQTKEDPDTSLDQKIIRQIEYYFGDYNLPRDKFLQGQIILDDGWIPLSTMLNFKRLASLTTDEDVIINAIKKSTLKLMEVDEEKKKIRRSAEKPVPEMTETRQKEIMSRTVYCKGFTKENATLDKLLLFFGQFGSIDNVQMRTYLDKATNEYIFKGSVFAVFTKKEDADEFMKKDSVEYDGVKLIVKTQEEYGLGKKKERDERKKIQKAKVQQATNRHFQHAGEKAQDEEGKDSDEEEEKGPGFPKGALIHMKDVPKTATWEDIKSAVMSVWREGAKEDEEKEIIVAYVDHRMGGEEGWIRLAEGGTAVTLLQRAKVVMKNKKSETGKVEEEKSDSKEKADMDTSEVNGLEKDKESGNKNDAEEKEGDDNDTNKKEDVDNDTNKKEDVDNDTNKKEDVDNDTNKKEDVDNDTNKKEDVDNGASKLEGDEDTVVKEEGEKDDVEVSYIEVSDGSMCIRAVQGTEEEEYLERIKEEREQRLQHLSRNKKRGGYGGNRRGRGGRGGKRRNIWDGGPSSKRRR